MDYARALVEHPKWRWEPGMGANWFQDEMIGTFLAFVTDASPNRVHIVTDRLFSLHPNDADLTPALEHPTTKGWLLHMLREALSEGVYATEPAMPMNGQAWAVRGYAGDTVAYGPTEGEALAAALLAAWGQT